MKKALGTFATGTEKSLEERRAAMNRVDRLPRPRKVDYVETTIGGIPAIVATPRGIEPDRRAGALGGARELRQSGCDPARRRRSAA